jgi:hypothetical protein
MFKILHGIEEYNIGTHVCNSVLASGTAVQLESLTGNTLVAATGQPLGFLMKSVTADGPSDFELETLIGIDAHEVVTGSYVPVVGGGPGVIQTDVVAAGITAATIGTDLKLNVGKWDVAASGDEVCGQLIGTPSSGVYKIQVLASGVRKGA